MVWKYEFVLLWVEKDKENVWNSPSNCSEKEKKIWSSAKSSKDSRGVVEQNQVTHLASRRSFCISQHEKVLMQRADVVAAATAAAADAAVAVAEAVLAVARVRLSTSQGGGGAMVIGDREKWAATKIQKIFRGYLATKALKALKAVVKVQALFRGYLFRKQIAAICMQALARAQAAVLSERACCSINDENPVTPFTTFCGDDTFFRPYSRYPNYMSGTESSRAKLRPPITPKQGPEPGTKKRLMHIEKLASRSSFSNDGSTQASRDEIMASRPSFSKVRVQKRSRCQVREDLAFCEILT